MGTRIPRRANGASERTGRAIEVRLAQIGMPRKVLAERAMVSVPYLSEVLRGVKDPTTSVLRRIAVATGLPSEHAIFEAAASLPTRYDAAGFGPDPACPSGMHIADGSCGCCSHCGQPDGH